MPIPHFRSTFPAPGRTVIIRISKRFTIRGIPQEIAATQIARVGIGHDTHQLRDGTSLRLGGVDIPHNRELVGHSDADVLLHALTDALLGAAGLGDIGEMFPDTDGANRGRESSTMLDAARRAVVEAGWQIANVDCIVFAEQPKLTPHKERIRRRLAEILEVSAEQIGLKAKTGEHAGPVGRQEAMEAQCVVLLVPRNEDPLQS